MKKYLFYLLLFTFQWSWSQPNQNWKGYFSYNQIKDLSESTTKVYAASENALFTKNIVSNNIQTINTIDGLSGQTISTIHHSDAFQKTVVGYESGLMIVINDIDGSMLNVVDIINKNLPANIKKINHFTEHEGILYLSCDFGIVQYKLATLEFGDTYFIGPNGQEIKVFQTTIFNGEIYAVTQLNGILKANLSNPNLIDFAQWTSFDGGYWFGITTFDNQLFLYSTNNKIYKHNGGFIEVANIGEVCIDFRATNDYLIAASVNHVYVINTGLATVAHVQTNQITSSTVTFTAATVINNTIYIGTNENGVLSALVSAPNSFEFIMPSGPTKNKLFAIDASSSNLWVTYGGYDIFYNPYTYFGFSPPQFEISKFNPTNGWLHIPYMDLLGAQALSKITVNPTNENQVFMSSYHRGLLKIESDIPTMLYDQTNSALESLVDGSNISVRINGSAFDRQGNLWVTNNNIKNQLKVLRSGGQWQSYNLEGILDNFTSANMNKIVIDRTGTKWMATYLDGVIAFNDTVNEFKKITEGPEAGNLPSRDVRAIAIDNRNQVWIGTNKGLRVLPSTGSYNGTEQMRANAIIILENDLAQELLYEQFITDIVVNGSNEKWIGTADSGVFLFSPNGQETIYHFTTDNSPLPSNVVNDIDINAETGEVFFATDRGMVSFQGTATKPADNLKDVYVYPNPVRPEFVGTVKIAGLTSGANIKITDVEGNLVYETTSTGGTIEWDTTAFGKYKVASGVYMIFIAAEDASETTVKKVMIIR